MLPSLLTAVFFALSAVVARRSILYVGPQNANFARQVIGLFLLGLWAHTWGQGFQGQTFWLFFVSGILGFGFGDWALFEALPRIGSALTVLLCQCLAAPIAALTERLWLGTRMTPVQMGSSALILIGVALALAPESKAIVPSGHRKVGIVFGILAACGQAWGAVVSRYAFQRAHETGFFIDGVSAAYQRLWGGTLSIGLLLLVGALHTRWRVAPSEVAPPPDWRRASPWLVANAIVGPTLGVSCYQWALKAAPSSLVLPVVATTPLVTMLIAFAVEGARPPPRAIVGSILAVVGVVILVTNA